MWQDSMSEIENEKAQRDIGTIAYRIFQGSRSEGSTRYEAFMIICAWFWAMMNQSMATEEDGDG